VRSGGVRFRNGVVEEVGQLEFKNVRELQARSIASSRTRRSGGEQVSAEAVLGILAISPSNARA
jgi:hypothetical protein